MSIGWHGSPRIGPHSEPMRPAVLLITILAALACPAHAGEGREAARCAAFWAAAADVRRETPGFGVSPESADALAQSFRAQAIAEGLEPVAADEFTARNRADFRLLHWAYLAGDAQSMALHDHLAQSCARQSK